MSVAASRYAIDWLRANRELGQGARAILLALAAAADAKRHEWHTGRWLAEAAGMNDDNVSRNVKRLEGLGAFAVKRERGKANLVRFPIAAALTVAPEGYTDANGAFHPTFCACPDCLERAAEG